MKIISTVKDLRSHLEKLNVSPVGLVPTMGALHDGHISLIKNATQKCPVIVVSIYVNPTQFNDKEDLKNYPRTIEADLALLSSHLRENDIVFTPTDKEIYPVTGQSDFQLRQPRQCDGSTSPPRSFQWSCTSGKQTLRYCQAG